jgi:hypothetical protein
LERDFKELSPEQRYRERMEKSKPVADAFFEWVDKLHALPKTPRCRGAGRCRIGAKFQ